MTTPVIHFATVIGGTELALLPRLVEHYRALGIESFRIVRQVLSVSAPEYAESEEYAREAGIRFCHTHVGPWSLGLHQRLIRFVMDRGPDDWYVVADSDEFHVYDRPLPDLVELCRKGGYDFVGGCLLDRLAADGGFPEVGGGSLWQQYPLAGSISAGLLKALPLKVALTHGSVELLSGQHGAPEGRQVPYERSSVQVHHFKWTASVVARLRERIAALESDGRRAGHSAIIRENRRFLRHIDRHGGRVDVDNPRFLLRQSAGKFADYPHWHEIVTEARGWQWGLT